MGKRGPLPKERGLKLLTGTLRGDRNALNPDERPVSKRAFAPPSYLGAHAREEWRRLEPILRPQGLLRPEFLTSFAGYCALVSQARHAESERARLTDGRHVNEALKWGGIARKAWTLAQKLGADFGLSPATRARSGLPTLPRPKPANPFHQLG